MAARKRAGFARRSPGRTDWSRFITPAFVVIPAGNKVLLATFALGNPGISETVRRTRGIISISSDQAAATENQIGAFGLVQANDLALAAGAASIPGPHTDSSDEGWFVWVPFAQSGAADLTAGVNSGQYEFDSKGMRTIDEGFGLAVMIENAHAVHGLRVTLAMSLLSSRS